MYLNYSEKLNFSTTHTSTKDSLRFSGINTTKLRHLEEELKYEVNYEMPVEVDASVATRDKWNTTTTSSYTDINDPLEIKIFISIAVLIFCTLCCYCVWRSCYNCFKGTKKVIKEVKEIIQSEEGE